MTISVIIPAYNEQDLLPKTLDALKHQMRKPDETIVIDASSTDQTKQIALSGGAKVITLEKKTIGYSRQQGMLACTGDIVAFTDADCVPPKDWLSRIEKTLQNPGTVAVFGSYRFYDGPWLYIWVTNTITPWFNLALHWCGITLATGQNIALIRAKALEAGGFPEDFKIAEDWEIAKRMKTVGKIVYDKNLIISTSGRRGTEGWGYIPRILKVTFNYFVLHKADRVGFPDIR